MKKQVTALVVSLIILSGCAIPSNQPPHVGITDDEFSKDVKIDGLKYIENPFGGQFREWYIRSWVDKSTNSTTHQLYFLTNYWGDWKFYGSAADDQANSLNTVSIDRSVLDCDSAVLGCYLTETVGVSLSDKALRQHANSTYRIKISAHNGESTIVFLTPQMTQMQLAAVDQYALHKHVVALHKKSAR